MAGGRSRRSSSNRGNRSARPAPARRAPDSTGQVGRRPSSPVWLLTIAVAWIACGIVALVALDASWKFVPGIVFIGIGLFFLRGAAATIVRHSERDARGR
jgi:hypothetical protein